MWRPAPILACLVLLGGCASSTPRYEFVDDPERDFDDLESELRIEPTTLGPGDAARLVLTLSNTGADFMQFRFPSRRQVGLAVYEASGDLYFTDVETLRMPRVVPLGALQSWTREIVWDGALEMGGVRRPLPPGRYEVQVGLRREGDVFVNRTNRVAIEIVGS